MAQGRRKPVELEILEGNPSHRPIPEVPQAPIREEDIIPPPFLDEYALLEWNRVVNDLHTMKVFAGIDQQSLAAYCISYSRWRHAEEELQIVAQRDGVKDSLVQSAYPHVLIGIANTAMTHMIKIAGEFGMTCLSRTKLGVKSEKKEKSKFAGLVGINGGGKK